MCSAKTVTTTPGKLGRAGGFNTRASRAGVGFYTTVYMYCNWFLSGFTLLAISIYLFYFIKLTIIQKMIYIMLSEINRIGQLLGLI